jgi:hypothetical protein
MTAQEGAHALYKLRAHAQVPLQRRPPQVQVPVLQPYRLLHKQSLLRLLLRKRRFRCSAARRRSRYRYSSLTDSCTTELAETLNAHAQVPLQRRRSRYRYSIPTDSCTTELAETLNAHAQVPLQVQVPVLQPYRLLLNRAG